MVEYTKGLEITNLKELGKLVPYVRKKGRLSLTVFGHKRQAAEKWKKRLFIKNTGLC